MSTAVKVRRKDPEPVLEAKLRGLVGKAQILEEALPYFRKFRGTTFVIKLGGACLKETAIKRSVLRDINTLQTLGIHPVVIHGGGPEISRMMARLGLRSRFVQGSFKKRSGFDTRTMNIK